MGALLVTGGLTVLVGQLNQMRAQVQSVVSLGNASTYDLLVRPRSTEPLNGYLATTGLTGHRGGITLDQLARIRALEEVAIAAPVTEAMVLELPLALPQRLPHGLYRASWSLAADEGAPAKTGEAWLWLLPSAASIPPALYERAGIAPVTTGETEKVLLPVTVGVRVVAIDPVAEAALVGLDNVITAGRYLEERDTGLNEPPLPNGQHRWELPVLKRAPGTGGLQIQLSLTPAGLGASPTEALLNDLAAKGGASALTSSLPANPAATWASGSGGTGAYLQALLEQKGIQPYYHAVGYEPPAPPAYTKDPAGPGVLAVAVGQQSWGALTGESYRAAGVDTALSAVFLPRYIGTYDPTRLTIASANDPLAPLYRPGSLASDFPGALVQDAPPLITTLEAATPFLPAAPIGSIRVKVAGDDVDSIMRAGKAIEATTGLQVEIIRGAAARPVQVSLGSGAPVTLQWLQLGTFLDYSREVERGDLGVLTLVAIVGLLFILSTAIVHVLLRGRELATLAALGWRRGPLLLLVGVEAAAVGGAGGLVALLLLRSGQALIAAALTLVVYTISALAAAALSGVGRPGDAQPPTAPLGRRRCRLRHGGGNRSRPDRPLSHRATG